MLEVLLAEGFIVRLVVAVLFITVAIVLWMVGGRLQKMPRFSMWRKRDDGKEQAIEERQNADLQQPVDLPSGEATNGPSEEAKLLLDLQELALDDLVLEEGESKEDPEQEDPQSGGTDLSDDLLSIFKTEVSEVSELDSLMEGLEEVDVNDLLQECRELAMWLRRRPAPS